MFFGLIGRTFRLPPTPKYKWILIVDYLAVPIDMLTVNPPYVRLFSKYDYSNLQNNGSEAIVLGSRNVLICSIIVQLVAVTG